MTREEVLRLTGRELDAAVAERVMGWVGPVHWVCNEPFMAVPVYDCPHPDCRRTDMPVRPELVGQVALCVCHICRMVVEPVGGGYVARLVEGDEHHA